MIKRKYTSQVSLSLYAARSYASDLKSRLIFLICDSNTYERGHLLLDGTVLI